MVKLLYTTNNACDTVLLVNDAGIICSKWSVTPKIMADFLASENISNWADHGLADEALTPEALGEVIAENGKPLPGYEELFRRRLVFNAR